MLRQASLAQIRSGQLSRRQGYLVACMAYYPRGLAKDRLDEYRANLAPDRELLTEWKEIERRDGHEAAFKDSRYEERFTLEPDALESLRRLTDIAQKRDVYLTCQCEMGERCHREMLLLLARKKFAAEIGEVFNPYPQWLSRI